MQLPLAAAILAALTARGTDSARRTRSAESET
jgi:hypothetical protein